MSNIFKRIKFALQYDIEPEFIVYSIPDQSAIRFLNYNDAKEFSDKQIQYLPKIMIAVRKKL